MPISLPKFITRAWASLGSKFDIPENADPLTGKAGYSQGFGPVNLTPVEAGGIPPWGQDMNGVLFDLSSAIQYVQAGQSFPFDQVFADAIGGYAIGSVVSDSSDPSKNYRSIIENNATPPPSAGWVVDGAVNFATQAQFDAHSESDLVVSPLVMQPNISGSATLTATNNQIVMTGIVSAMGLEKGDVIKITGAGAQNDKLRTVESITNGNTIVVNYEHCGSRGNGPLILSDYNGNVTVKRISKWFNASEGLGQDWVSLSSFASIGVDKINSTNRVIGSSYTRQYLTSKSIKIGEIAANAIDVSSQVSQIYMAIPAGATYSITGTGSSTGGFTYLERR